MEPILLKWALVLVVYAQLVYKLVLAIRNSRRLLNVQMLLMALVVTLLLTVDVLVLVMLLKHLQLVPTL